MSEIPKDERSALLNAGHQRQQNDDVESPPSSSWMSSNNNKNNTNNDNHNHVRRWHIYLTAFVATVACAFCVSVTVSNTSAPSWFTKEQSIVVAGDKNNSMDTNDEVYRHYRHVNSHLPTNSKYKFAQYLGYQMYAGGAPAFVGRDGMALHTTADEEAVAIAAAKKNSSLVRDTMVNPECIAAGGHSFGTVATETDDVLQCYLGHHDPMKDVARRLEVMRGAVEKAYEEADQSNHTLKVFIAPEFFWRGLPGAYSFHHFDELNFDDCLEPVCALLKGLEELTEDKRFEDWLFMFGTVIARQELPEASDDDPYKYLYYNFAPIYKGFDPDSTMGGISRRDAKGKRFLLPKRVVSTSDFLTPSYKLRHESWLEHSQELLGEQNQPDTPDNPFYFRRARYDDAAFFKFKELMWEKGSYAMLEFDWLMVDGLSVAIEICMDHFKGTALGSYLGDMVTGRTARIPSSDDNVASVEYVPIPPYQAQIQLVASAGMTAVPKSFALAEGGILFHQDGLSNATNHQYHDSNMLLTCDQGQQFTGGTSAITRSAVISPTDVNFLYKVVDPVRKVPVFENPKEALRGVFSAAVYKPHIVVHPPTALPEVNTMGKRGAEAVIDPGI